MCKFKIIKYDSDKKNYIISLANDKKKIKKLKHLKYLRNKVLVIHTLSSDEKKLEFIEQIDNLTYKAFIASSLKYDEPKLKLIDQLPDLEDKFILISSLSNDNLKLDFIKKLCICEDDDELKTAIILSLSDDKLKIKEFLKHKNITPNTNYANDDLCNELFDSLQDSEQKIVLLNTINFDYKTKDKISKLSEEAKLSLLNGENIHFKNLALMCIKDKESIFKALELSTLTQEEKKELYLNLPSEPEYDKKKFELICNDYETNNTSSSTSYYISNLYSDELKQILLKKYDVQYSLEVIASLKSDSLKKEWMNHFDSESARSEIVKSLSNDKDKLKYLNTLPEESYDYYKNSYYSSPQLLEKIHIIESLKYDKNKLKALKKVGIQKENRFITLNKEKRIKKLLKFIPKNYWYITIDNIKDLNIKLAYIKKLPTPNNIRYCLEGLGDFDKVLENIHLVNDDEIKTNLIYKIFYSFTGLGIELLNNKKYSPLFLPCIDLLSPEKQQELKNNIKITC